MARMKRRWWYRRHRRMPGLILSIGYRWIRSHPSNFEMSQRKPKRSEAGVSDAHSHAFALHLQLGRAWRKDGVAGRVTIRLDAALPQKPINLLPRELFALQQR